MMGDGMYVLSATWQELKDAVDAGRTVYIDEYIDESHFRRSYLTELAQLLGGYRAVFTGTYYDSGVYADFYPVVFGALSSVVPLYISDCYFPEQ